MNDFFEIKKQLEEKGFSNIEMIAGGKCLVANRINEIHLFDLNLNRIPLSDQIKVEKVKDKENTYKISINSYETEYTIA